MVDRLLRFAVRHVADGDAGDELDAMVSEAVRHGSRRDAIAELLGLAALALRLRCRRATGDHPVVIWRQGLWIGALLLALDTLIELGVGAVDDRSPLGAVTVLAASAAYVGAVIGKPVVVTVVAPVSFALTVLVIVGQPGPGSDLVRLAVLGVAGVLGTPVRPRRPRRAVIAWSVPVLVAVSMSALLGAEVVLDATTVAIVAGVGATGLAAGWFDPRLAVAVTVVWTWRFLAVDPPRVGDALLALAGDLDLEALLVRWIAMAAGVACGLVVSRLSVRRAVAL